MRVKTIGLAFGAMLLASRAFAYDAYDPANCNGVDWNDKQTLVVSKVTSAPRVQLHRSPYDDDFTAASCPSATDACRKKSYLVANDLVLTGKMRGDFTCVVYQSLSAKKRTWSKGWLPTTALVPVAPMPSPQQADWLGTWTIPGGGIEIKRAAGGKLHIMGEMVVPGAQDAHSGVIEANAMAANGTIAFVDDGGTPFEKAEGECRVRMQRFGSLLMVEDNDGCGGVGVTFTGLYQRKK
jgi:hypothetical protein